MANLHTINSAKAFYPKLWIGITYSSSDGSTYFTSTIYLMRGVPVGTEIPVNQLAASLVHCEAS